MTKKLLILLFKMCVFKQYSYMLLSFCNYMMTNQDKQNTKNNNKNTMKTKKTPKTLCDKIIH